MVAATANTIKIMGWRAVPNNGWYDIYSPQGRYCGAAMTAEAATEMLDEKSGAAHLRLPAIKHDAVRVELMPWQHVREFGRYYEYQHKRLYLGDRFLGMVQTKKEHGRFQVISSVNDRCVIGHDVDWILKENGLRFE